MKHKYNIEHLLQSIIGYKGLPYPGAFSPNRPAGSYTGDNFDIPTSPAPHQKAIMFMYPTAMDCLRAGWACITEPKR